MTEPLTLSIKDAAKKLGFGQDTVRELVRSGKLASIAKPPSYRNRVIPVAAIEQYISNEMGGGQK